MYIDNYFEQTENRQEKNVLSSILIEVYCKNFKVITKVNKIFIF